MWMCYAENNWPKASDLVSSLERLRCEFEARAFECDHDSIYREWGDEDASKMLKEDATRHEEAGQLIEDFFDDENSCIICLCMSLAKMGYKHEISNLRKYYTVAVRRRHREQQHAIFDKCIAVIAPPDAINLTSTTDTNSVATSAATFAATSAPQQVNK